MGADAQQLATVRGDAPGLVECVQRDQQLARLGEVAGRRWIEEAQLVATPGCQLQRQWREVGVDDLGAALGVQALVRRPQAQRVARPEAAGAAGALGRRGQRDGHRFQPREADVRIEARLARKARIDHRAHAGQGQAGLGDIGCEHHAPAARRGRRHRRRLRLDREFAVQRDQVDVRRHACGERALRLVDLAPARQEGEHIALAVRERLFDAACEVQRGTLLAARRQVLDGHRMRAPGALHAFGVQPLRQPRAVEGGRHHQDAQVLAQPRLRVERQREAQVGGQVALVELIEDQATDAG
ncbi:MAG: hypothetical protein OMOMHJEC_02463 [Xanthomonadales bacterium]|nr:hypothetical protein [Xanthomonadales bacterium]